jgi:hypothetical protein
LSKIPQRTLKNANDRIIGEGDNVKGAIRRMLIAYQKKPKDAFDQWKKYLEMVRNKQLLDTIKVKQLNEHLHKIPKRTLRNGFNKVIGEGDNVKARIPDPAAA